MKHKIFFIDTDGRTVRTGMSEQILPRRKRGLILYTLDDGRVLDDADLHFVFFVDPDVNVTLRRNTGGVFEYREISPDEEHTWDLLRSPVPESPELRA